MAQQADSPTLAHAILNACDGWSDRVAFKTAEGSWSYARFRAAVMGLAEEYRRLEIGHGDRVISWVENSPEYIIAMAAAWICGAVHVGIDYQSRPREIVEIAQLVGAKVIAHKTSDDTDDASRSLESVRMGAPGLKMITVDAKLADSMDEQNGAGVLGEHAGPEDHAIIFISSGTTGKPKATIGYHGNLARRWKRLGAWLGFVPEDVHLAHLPLSHGFGLMMATTALLTGGSLVFQNKFSGDAALNLIEAQRITVFNGAPSHFMLLLKHLNLKQRDVKSLRFSVGTAAHFVPALIQDIWQKLGVKFMYMYGSSEGVGVATTDPEEMLMGSVGKPPPGSVRIVDEDHQPLPPGQTGEISFSRNVYPVRYVGEARPEEWYYSGDLGRLDEAGRLFVSGRLKQQIDRGGLKVDPLEVANALLRFPEIADAVVIGMPNPVLGATVCACIVPAGGALMLTLEGLRERLGSELAPHKLPELLWILDEIPRTQLGKTDETAIREKLIRCGQYA